ncbi:MAG TPA: DUF72 domain-containing protein [Methylomirabilota bacterium]
MAGRIFIGTSGYAYPHWRRRFYPKAVPLRAWLAFYTRHFSTVELNNPFYRLPDARHFTAWRHAVPDGFVFAVKASRFLTHIKRLRQPADPLRRFLGRARRLQRTLGPVLFQLPGHFHADLGRLDRFLAALGRQRYVRDLRAVLEVRHASWLEPTVISRLEQAGVALCLADWSELPVTDVLTADFVYIRRHGRVRYGGSYSEASLKDDARRIRGWQREGRDVYVYFNNDRRAFAVRNALTLRALVGQSAPAGPTPAASRRGGGAAGERRGRARGRRR